MALYRTVRMTLVLCPLLVAAACVSQTNAPKAGNAPGAGRRCRPDLTAPQPRTATYNCADGGKMTIENLGTSVHVLGPDGTSEDLPASPANQSSRFGQAHDAIVIDGREALVMKGGKTPLACKRWHADIQVRPACKQGSLRFRCSRTQKYAPFRPSRPNSSYSARPESCNRT